MLVLVVSSDTNTTREQKIFPENYTDTHSA